MEATNSYEDPMRIAHDYRDYGLEAAVMQGRHPQMSPGAPSHNDPFPVQLHWMLEQTEKVGLSSVVGWSPHGRAFVVRDRDQFVDDILPIYFKQTKITSFQRQLSLYGFKRITKGPDSGSYYHPKFLRNSRVFARNLVRTKVKNNGPRKAAAPEDEPDFYTMPKLSEPIKGIPYIKSPVDTGRELPSKAPSSDLQQHLPLVCLQNLMQSEAAESPSAPSSMSDLTTNRLLTRHLLQRQLETLVSLMGRNAKPAPSSPGVRPAVPSTRPSVLLSTPSSSTFPQVLSSTSTRSSLSSMACRLAQRDRLVTATSLSATAASHSQPVSLSQTVSELIFRQRQTSFPSCPKSTNDVDRFLAKGLH